MDFELVSNTDSKNIMYYLNNTTEANYRRSSWRETQTNSWRKLHNISREKSEGILGGIPGKILKAFLEELPKTFTVNVLIKYPDKFQ